MSSLTREQIWNLARAVHPFAVDARRRLHRQPELSFQEQETSAFVTAELCRMGYEPQTGIGGYGLKAVLQGLAGPGPTVALRADMDALPVLEETGLPFASERPGVMHACGHDVHTATLLATAQALKGLQGALRGRVVFIFQPGEEVNPGGASLMVNDGVLENPPVDYIFGLHADPSSETGTMAFGAGPRLAAPDEFDATIRGKGGHGAHPDDCVDSVLVACQAVTLLQQIVARNVSPFAPAVITIGSIHGGSARNVIPDEVALKGTVRTMDPDLQRLMPVRIEQVIRGVCEAAGATYELKYTGGYPVMVNDPGATEIARRAALAVLPAEAVLEMPPSMGGEDFAFYLQHVPGTFARLGVTAPGTQDPAGLHTGKLMIDEESLAVGVAFYISTVQASLG